MERLMHCDMVCSPRSLHVIIAGAETKVTRKTAGKAENPARPQIPPCDIQFNISPANICITLRSLIDLELDLQAEM